MRSNTLSASVEEYYLKYRSKILGHIRGRVNSEEQAAAWLAEFAALMEDAARIAEDRRTPWLKRLGILGIAAGVLLVILDATAHPSRAVRTHAGHQPDLRQVAEPVRWVKQSMQESGSGREGWIHFENASLKEVVDELQPHVNEQIIITSQKAADLRVGGTFNVDRIDSLFEALESLLPIKVTKRGDKIYIDYRVNGHSQIRRHEFIFTSFRLPISKSIVAVTT